MWKLFFAFLLILNMLLCYDSLGNGSLNAVLKDKAPYAVWNEDPQQDFLSVVFPHKINENLDCFLVKSSWISFFF